MSSGERRDDEPVVVGDLDLLPKSGYDSMADQCSDPRWNCWGMLFVKTTDPFALWTVPEIQVVENLNDTDHLCSVLATRRPMVVNAGCAGGTATVAETLPSDCWYSLATYEETRLAIAAAVDKLRSLDHVTCVRMVVSLYPLTLLHIVRSVDDFAALHPDAEADLLYARHVEKTILDAARARNDPTMPDDERTQALAHWTRLTERHVAHAIFGAKSSDSEEEPPAKKQRPLTEE